jgi:hypothetical protein
MMKTVLITGSIGMIIGFAVGLLLFLVMLIGSYWFVMVEPGKDKEKRPTS